MLLFWEMLNATDDFSAWLIGIVCECVPSNVDKSNLYWIRKGVFFLNLAMLSFFFFKFLGCLVCEVTKFTLFYGLCL